jgi:xanthosine utilization system XapX-like protein
MTDKTPWRHAPTRSELWFWLAVSAGGLGFLAVAVWVRGLPSGPAIAEVIGIAGVVFGYLGGRSIKRLIRHEHP